MIDPIGQWNLNLRHEYHNASAFDPAMSQAQTVTGPHNLLGSSHGETRDHDFSYLWPITATRCFLKLSALVLTLLNWKSYVLCDSVAELSDGNQ